MSKWILSEMFLNKSEIVLFNEAFFSMYPFQISIGAEYQQWGAMLLDWVVLDI